MVPESQRAMRLAQSFLMAAAGFVVFGGVAVFIEGLHDPCSGDADVCVDGKLPEGAANPQMEAIVTYTMPIACAWGMACLLFVHHALPPLAASRKPSRPSLIGEAFNNLRVTAKKLGKFPQTSWYLANEAVVACGDTTIATLFSVIALDKLGLASADVAQVMSVSIVFVVTSNMIAGVLMKRELLTPIKLIIIGRSGTVLNSLYEMRAKRRALQAPSLTLLSPRYFAFYVRDLKTFWISGIFFGCFNGLLGVTSTQLFSSLVPPVYKSEFFALRSVNAKLLAWIGPLLFAVVTTAGSFELAVASLVVYTVAGTVLLLRVDVARGMDAALNFEEEEEEEEEGGVGVGAGGVELTKQKTTKEHTMVLV
jgi:MFS-type transporter involved in bile tolerance (Atg22 family)